MVCMETVAVVYAPTLNYVTITKPILIELSASEILTVFISYSAPHSFCIHKIKLEKRLLFYTELHISIQREQHQVL